MKNTIGANIARLRRERRMTQEALAEQLHVSFQAVSKWENGQTLPDIAVLARIAEIMQTSIDSLAGHPVRPQVLTPYQQWYDTEEYYWGTRPSDMCLQILSLLPPDRPLRLLDIGCGEGKDAVFMARCGYAVSAFDITQTGIDKTRRLADRAGVYVDAFVADVNEFRPEQEYDILFSSGVLHYIRPELRADIFSAYQAHTSVNGLHALNVFVPKPFIAPPPEVEVSYDWHSGELFALYRDWKHEVAAETIFDCNSSGIPHQHCMDVLIARKMLP